MSNEPTKLINKRGIAYQCMTCGKVDQRHRLKIHIYKEHVERGNVPFLCSPVVFFGTPTPVWRITLCTRCTLTIYLYMVETLITQTHLFIVPERRGSCPLAGEVRGDLAEEDSCQWWGMVWGPALPVCRRARWRNFQRFRT